MGSISQDSCAPLVFRHHNFDTVGKNQYKIKLMKYNFQFKMCLNFFDIKGLIQVNVNNLKKI